MSFKDIQGQEQAIQLLKEYIRQDRLSGGYLFLGQEGVGKKLVAKTLAKAVNCLEDNGDACDKCTSCLKIEKNQHPDVIILENINAEIKIDSIREIQRKINLRPYEGKVKVFIIDNAHTLTAEAQNALLKILEEPPRKSLIILISDKSNLLFKTILSRCKVLRFVPFSRTQLQEILRQSYGFDSNLAHFLAYFSEGRFGSALRLSKSDILREKNRIIDKFIFSRKPSFDNFPIQSKEELRSYLNILATWFRDIYLLKAGMPHSEIINLDRKGDLLRVMSHFSFLDLDRVFNTISESLLYLERNINTKLLLHNLGVELWKA